MLLGRIVGVPTGALPLEQVGALYFEDSTGEVICEVENRRRNTESPLYFRAFSGTLNVLSYLA